MSYFTDGLAVLKADSPKLQAALADLAHPYLFVDLNAKWVAVVLEQPDDPARPWVERYSHDFPILWFYDAEDHGWGYIIFHEGEEKASLDVSYEIGYGLYRQIAELLYPDRDIHDGIDLQVIRQIQDLIDNSEKLQQDVRDQYIHSNPEEFTVLGLSEDDIERLRETTQPDFPRKYNPHAVDEFKKHLNLLEMNWKNYDVLKRDLEEGRL
jgi:hypothetical protein